MAYSTGKVGWMIDGCDSIEELKESILPLLQDQRNMWQDKIEEILSQTGYSCKQFAQLCKVSEPTVRKWRKGSLPQSRDMYIRIGFAAGYGLDQMNAFLMRYGRCPQLYVKSLEDSVCMFVLHSNELTHTYDTYQGMLNIVRQELNGGEDAPQIDYSTQQLSEDFFKLSSMEEMISFAQENVPSYQRSYKRLYSYIIAFLHENLVSEHSEGDRKTSFHEMANESNWSSSLRHCISEIRNKKWFPLRNKIISLGLHLNMEISAINYMLQCAQMEPLYAKNPIEAAVMWAVNEAVLSSENVRIETDGSSDLCEFVKDILIQLNLSESEFLIDDL